MELSLWKHILDLVWKLLVGIVSWESNLLPHGQPIYFVVKATATHMFPWSLLELDCTVKVSKFFQAVSTPLLLPCCCHRWESLAYLVLGPVLLVSYPHTTMGIKNPSLDSTSLPAPHTQSVRQSIFLPDVWTACIKILFSLERSQQRSATHHDLNPFWQILPWPKHLP